MKSINSLSEFIEKLDESDLKTLPKVIKSVAIPFSEFEKHATWNQESYTRNCIARTDTYELILLCWEKKQETPIHEHGGQKCWVYQINGEVDECRYQKDSSGKLSETLKIHLSAGNITYMDNEMGYHTLKNIGNQRAMTLHIYVKPIDSCKVFCNEKKSFITKELEYDSLVKEI
jgi:cysteine dioxygenase